jgi:hypothetical protein
VGDEVIGFTGNRASHAEFVITEAADLVHRPANVSWEAAGSLFVAGTTAYAAARAVAVGPVSPVVHHPGRRARPGGGPRLRPGRAWPARQRPGRLARVGNDHSHRVGNLLPSAGIGRLPAVGLAAAPSQDPQPAVRLPGMRLPGRALRR